MGHHPDVAEALFAARVAELQQKRKGRVGLTSARSTRLAELARDHLIRKAKAGRTSRSHLNDLEQRLGVIRRRTSTLGGSPGGIERIDSGASQERSIQGSWSSTVTGATLTVDSDQTHWRTVFTDEDEVLFLELDGGRWLRLFKPPPD